jgi:hypothetical protein
MLLIALFVLLLALFFFFLAHISKNNDDEGAASINIAIGILLIILDVIYFIVLVNALHLYDV